MQPRHHQAGTGVIFVGGAAAQGSCLQGGAAPDFCLPVG